MSSSFIPPRQVTIGDAASFVGTTPQAIRHYHEIGLLPESERGSEDRRRYGYDELIQLLWIHRMVGAGIALEDIRDVFADKASAGAERLRTPVGRMDLLSDVVTSRLESLPEGSLRPADLDNLLVIEQMFGPLGAAVNATRYIAMAAHPEVREESDRVDAAEEALDDTIAVDDPRVAQVAAQRHAFELALDAVIEESGLAESDEALFDSWDALHPAATGDSDSEAGQDSDRGQSSMSMVEAFEKMPYDWSPARLRCMELVEEIAAHESTSS